ncbi:MAG TPA: hypothetical protein VFK41_08905 [Nocardioidaceae bacterium]|nr:hypothetical protein [Nocardioidaceae bacterium]
MVAFISAAVIIAVTAVGEGMNSYGVGQAIGAMVLPALIVGAIARFMPRRWPTWLFPLLIVPFGLAILLGQSA